LDKITEQIAKQIAFSHFDKINGVNSHLGIANTCLNGQRALEMYAHLRYEAGDELEHSVWNDKPISYSNEKVSIEFEKD
jgi:hypothetical protein